MLHSQRALRRARNLCSVTAVCAVSAVAFAACGSSDSSDEPAASADAPTKIVTAWPADVTSLDPANLSTNEDHALTRNIYQTLALPDLTAQENSTLKPNGAKVKPYLAESWDVGDNTITYKLRDGVTFYGTDNPMTAEDVKFSIDRIFDTPGAGDLQSNGLQGPDSVEIVDDMTVKLTFTDKDGKPVAVTPTQLYMFSQHFTGIVDAKAAKEHVTSGDKYAAKWLRQNTAGSGPYYLADRTPGESITLKAIDKTWTPTPNYTDVTIRITSGSIASLMQSKEINYADTGLTSKQVDDLGKAGDSVFWQTTGNFDMFAITVSPEDEVGPLADKNVRKAMAYALPYDEVLNNVHYGRAERAGSLVQPSAPEYKDSWSQYETDIDKAKEYMAKAGNPKVNVPLHYLQGNDDQSNTAILVQSQLKKVGIETKLTPETQAGLFDVVNARSQPEKGKKIGPPGLELFNWSGFTDDPSIVLGYWTTTGGINNYALYSNPEVDAIHKENAPKPTSDERTAAYGKAQDIIAEDAAYIPIVNTGALTVTQKGIEGVSFSPGGSSRYWTLYPSGEKSEIDSTLFG